MALSEAVLKRIENNIASGKIKVNTAAQKGKGTKTVPTHSSPNTVRQRMARDGSDIKKKNFYSRPDVDADMEAAGTNAAWLEKTWDEKFTALETAGTSLKTVEESVSFWADKVKTLADSYSKQPQDAIAALYDKAYAYYEQAYKDYEAAAQVYDVAYLAYKPVEEAYNHAVTQYQGYVDQLAQWKSTVRPEAEIQAEQERLRKELLPAAPVGGSYLQGRDTVGLAAAYGAAPSLGDREQAARQREIGDRLKLLEEEMQWRREFDRQEKREKLEAVDDPAFAALSGYAGTGYEEKEVPYLQGRDTVTTGEGYSPGTTAQKPEADLTYEYINRSQSGYDGGDSGIFEERALDQMTPKEVAIYNYYYAKGGKEQAQEYLDVLQDELNRRKAAQVYAGLKGKTLQQMGYAVKAGVDQFATGAEGAFRAIAGDGRYVPASVSQYVSQKIREELAASDGWKLPEWAGGAPVGQVAYDAITTTANMVPSILASTALGVLDPKLGAGFGAAMMGGSAGGAAYQEMINAGYDVGQARGYALLVGASEAALEKVLGGISKLGGGFSTARLVEKLNGVNNAFIRVAGKLGVNALAEAGEEAVQEVLTPIFRNMVTEKDDAAIDWGEVAYAGLLGFLSAVPMEAGSVRAEDRQIRTGRDTGQDFLGGGNAAIQNRYTGKLTDKLEKLNLSQEDIQIMIEEGLDSDPGTDSYQIAKDLQKKLDSGKELSKTDLSRLQQANTIAIEAEQQAQEADGLKGLSLPTLDGPVETGNSQTLGEMKQEPVRGLSLPTLEDSPSGIVREGANPAQRPGQNNTLNGGTEYADTYGQPARPTAVDTGSWGQRPGAGVLSGSGQRYDGAGAPEQAGKLAGGTGAAAQNGRAQADRFRIAAERRNLVKDLRTGKVSARSLGIASGTEKAALQVVPEDRWDDSMRQKAEQVYQETGKTVTYVLGGIEIQGKGQGTATVKGVITDSGIIVRADHIAYTAEQIADHEAYHGMKDIYKGMRDGSGRTMEEAMVQRIRERYTPEEFDRVVEQYILALDGLFDVQGVQTRQQYEARIEAVVEEVLADAYAGMNMWGAGAAQFTDTVREYLEENNISRRPGAENGVRETNGPPAEARKNTAESGGERYSISNQEMQNVQSIGRKSANAFTTRDIKLADSLAKRYWVEMDVKSPFFRAWFGDWRINDAAPIQLANQRGDTRGVQKNIDTGWDIQVSGKVFNETKRHTDSYNMAAQPYLAVINDIVRKAILLDTYGADPKKLKSPNTLLMHSLYAVADTGNGPEIIKLYVEEMNNPNSEQTGKRAYQLQDIEKYQLQNGSSQNTASSISSATGNIYTIADLFAAVKQYDAAFNPKPCSLVTNPDGTPKVMHHGTRAENGDFYVFDESKAVKKGGLGLKALGKGNYFTAKKLDGTERDGPRVIVAYLNIRNPFVYRGGISFYEQVRNELGIDPQIGADAIQQEMRNRGYDGVIQYDGNGEVSLAVTFDSEQIKSATDNIGTFDGSNPDIRYSVDDISEAEDLSTEDYDVLEKEFQAKQRDEKERFLRERLGDGGYEKFKADREAKKYQKKADDAARTKAARLVETNRRKLRLEEEMQKVDHAERRRLRDETKPVKAKKVLHDTVLNLFSIPAGQRAELRSMLDSYADRLIKKGSFTEEDRKRLFDRMYESGVMTMPVDEYFETGRNTLRGGRVYVSEQIRKEFGDDWNDIKRRLFANKIYVTSSREAGGIDSWNHELAELLPGMFHPEDTDLRDILERILYVAEQGREEKVSLAEYAARLAGQEYISERDFQDNMERQLDWALRTFATSAGIEIKTREEDIRKQSSTRRQNLKLQATLAAERQERREKAEAARSRKELQELQQKTLKAMRWLSQNRRRAPEELRKVFDEVLGDIDLLAVGAANEMMWSDKYNATWKNLAQMYKDAKSNDPNFMPSKDLENIVQRLDTTKIGDMDLGALQDLYKAAVGLRTEFYNRNNMMNDEMHRLFEEVYEDIKGEMEAAPGKYTGKAADKFFNAEQLTPMNLMQRMGGWDPDGTFYSMAKQLEKGEKDMRRYHVQAQQMLQTFLEENQEWVKKADGQGKDGIWYELEVPELVQLNMGDKPIFGDTVKVAFTPAQKVHMYLESKNIDNLRHMTGGRTFADRKLYSEGKRQEAFAQGTTIRLAPETVKKIVSDLTAEEMELARILEQYYNSFATGEINRVSNILNGYDKAMGKNYAPIYTNSNYNKTEFGVFDVTAEGVGNLKERQHSKNPSYNIGAFDAFERHVDHTARYVGMAIPVRNWNTLMNWRERNNSMADMLTHKWGKEAKEQVEEIINALQAGESFQKDSISTLAGKIQSNYISAIFGANPSIVLKQLGSIPMASAYLGTANVPKPSQLKNIDRGLISRYTKELDWRLMGYATPETKHLKDNPNWTQSNKTFRFLFGGDAITAMDGWAASTLWPWAENKVRKEHPELEIGTPEQVEKGESPFYKKVAEEFENALVRSQSVSDEIHQSHLRKSKNPITRAFTMFRSDSAQTYNAIRQKIGEARFYVRTGAKEKAVKAAKRAAGEAFCAMLINASWASAVSFLMALWKNKAKNYRDDEDELTAASIAGQMVSDIVGSVAGIATGGEELYDLIGNIITGDKWYSFETPGMEQLNDVMEIIYESGSGMRDLIAGGWDIVKNSGDLGKYFDDHSGDILGSIRSIAEAAAQYVAGLPVGNVEAYLLGTVKWISPKLGAAYDDLFSEAGKSGLSGVTGDALEGRIGGILNRRGISETEETADVLAGLYEAGHKDAVPMDVPASVSVNEEQRKLSAYQQQTYDTAWSSAVSEGLDALVDSTLFRSGDADLQERMLKNLYSYAAEKAKEAVFDDYMVSSGTVQIAKLLKEGVSLADAVAWRTTTSEMKTGEKLGLLKEWNIGEDAKAAFVGAVFGGELMTESGKPTQYAKFQYSVEQGMSVDEYLEVYTNGGNVDKYLEMMHEGVDHDAAQYYAEEVEELVPLDSKGTVADIQKWRIAVDASRSEEQQMTMLYILMDDGPYQKVETAHAYGVKPEDYVRLQEILPEHDADHSGGYKQVEIQSAIDALARETELTKDQKAALWQVLTGAKSAKKNPYSPQVGQRIIDAREAADAEPEDEEDDLSFGEVVMRQLMNR